MRPKPDSEVFTEISSQYCSMPIIPGLRSGHASTHHGVGNVSWFRLTPATAAPSAIASRPNLSRYFGRAVRLQAPSVWSWVIPSVKRLFPERLIDEAIPERLGLLSN